MKKIFTILLISSFLTSLSQNNSGIVSYEETTSFNIDMKKLEEQGLAGLANNFPTSNSTKKQLIFAKEVTLYSNKKIDKKDNDSETQIMFMTSDSDNKTYINLQNKEVIEQRDFMGKGFLINGSLEKLNWKITGETKIILNYPCIKALLNDSNKTIEAWFTVEIPLSIGPENYGQLPGMILELTSKETRKTIKAIDFKYTEVNIDSIKIPSEGKKVTKEEYNKIVDKKIKEMQQEYGGSNSGGSGGTIIIQQQ